MIKQIVKAENGYINSSHPEFNHTICTEEELKEMIDADHPDYKLINASEVEKANNLTVPYEVGSQYRSRRLASKVNKRGPNKYAFNPNEDKED